MVRGERISIHDRAHLYDGSTYNITYSASNKLPMYIDIVNFAFIAHLGTSGSQRHYNLQIETKEFLIDFIIRTAAIGT